MVLIDVLRATTVICTALGEGVKSIKPVKNLNEALAKGRQAAIVAAERNGKQVPDADLGNSPQPFLGRLHAGSTLILTTSNGTKALEQVQDSASRILAGSFLNATALVQELRISDQDVLLLCAGRHGHYSLEDTMLAGYLIAHCQDHLSIASDAALGTVSLYKAHEQNWQNFLYQGTHARYLKTLGKEADIAYAFQLDRYPWVPEFVQGELKIHDN